MDQNILLSKLNKRIRIASRKSDLARIQAYTVGERIQSFDPKIQIEYLFRESLGDKNLNDPLWKIPEKGVFTQDFYQDLVDDKCDVVVHSWKDLAVEENPQTFVTATFPREDVRDVLLIKKSHFEKLHKTKKICIYTSSPRRMFHFERFAKTFLPFGIEKCAFESVRGNIQTRMKKMLVADEIDGILMAKAGIDRMLQATRDEFRPTQDFFRQALQNVDFMILPMSTNPQAPAQGALALEIRRDRVDLIDLFAKLNHQQTFQAVSHEREILKSYGGGCHSKIGVCCILQDDFQLQLISGEIENHSIEKQEFLSVQTAVFQKAFLENEIYVPTSSEFFKMIPHVHSQQIIQQIPQSTSETMTAVELAKMDYVADMDMFFDFLKNKICWTSGLETWKKLAKQKVWVHGTQESLGATLPKLQTLFGRKISWYKITHAQAASLPGYQSSDARPIAVCDLQSTKLFPNLAPFKAFFWKSGSLFLKAVAEQPEILKKQHFCGLGESQKIISAHLKHHKQTNSVYAFLNEKLWRDYVTKI